MSGGAAAQLITQAKSAFDIAFVSVLVAGTAIMLLMAAVIAKIISRGGLDIRTMVGRRWLQREPRRSLASLDQVPTFWP
jgi:hypothetical protein